MAQTRYTIDQTGAFSGMLADLGDKYIVSKSAEGEINFGYAVMPGTAGDQVKVSTGALLGVAVHTHKEDGKYLDKDTVNVLRKGAVYVRLTTGQTPAIGGAVYVNNADGTFRTDATGGTLVTGAVFASTAVDSSNHSQDADADGAVAVVEFNLP